MFRFKGNQCLNPTIETLIAENRHWQTARPLTGCMQPQARNYLAYAMRILKEPRTWQKMHCRKSSSRSGKRHPRYSAGQQAPMAWLVTIARNHAIDVIRANKRSS